MTTTRAALSIGLATLVLGGTALGFAANAGGYDQPRAVKEARNHAGQARTALEHGKPLVAIADGEAAVALAPQDASYRMLLGQAYLKAGRFTSAAQAFADVLSLDAGNGKAALNLALAQIACGTWDDARRTLDAHITTIPASDRGLAMALAGDPAGAVELLSAAARAPDADAKTRQNLALAFALAGRWPEAKMVAAVDVSPADLDARLVQWAAFAKPASASDQVSALLGVTPVLDPGQPVTLALNAAPGVALAAKAPVESYMPGATPAPEALAVAQLAAPAPSVDTAPAQVASVSANVRFLARQEVVQALPPRPSRDSARGQGAVRLAAAKPAPVRLAGATRAPARAGSRGNYYVQIGAYQNANVAHDAWGRVTRRFASFGGHTPSGAGVTTKAGNFYRLSIGGFARADAVQMCQSYRGKGGACFVRVGAGDEVARWARGPELASR